MRSRAEELLGIRIASRRWRLCRTKPSRGRQFAGTAPHVLGPQGHRRQLRRNPGGAHRIRAEYCRAPSPTHGSATGHSRDPRQPCAETRAQLSLGCRRMRPRAGIPECCPALSTPSAQGAAGTSSRGRGESARLDHQRRRVDRGTAGDTSRLGRAGRCARVEDSGRGRVQRQPLR